MKQEKLLTLYWEDELNYDKGPFHILFEEESMIDIGILDEYGVPIMRTKLQMGFKLGN